MVRDKVRIRFCKAGDLRWTSHHDLLRCFERMLRRAALPFRSTEGFNPRPCLVFAQPLALGLSGADEIVDLELNEVLEPADIHVRLTRQAPPGLDILAVTRVPPRTPLRPRLAIYRLELPEERVPAVSAAAATLLDAPDCWIERLRPAPRCLNIRPYIVALRVGATFLDLHLAITPNGSTRPDEVLRQLGLGDLLDAGAVPERTALELHDECQAPGPDPIPEPERNS